MLASSTSLLILARADSLSHALALALSVPSFSTKPASKISPFLTSLGRLSPVIAEVSTKALPLITSLSRATLIPALNSISSPIFTSLASTCLHLPPFSSKAVRGRSATSSFIASFERVIARSLKYSPII